MTAPTNTLDAEQPGRWATASRAKQEVNDPTASGDGSFTPSNAEVEPRPRGSLGTPADPCPRPAGSPAASAPSDAAGPTCPRCQTPPDLWVRGWCKPCYTYWLKTGQPASGPPMAPFAVTRGTGLRPCGTEAAYKRHLANGETACDDCKAEHSAYVLRWKQNAPKNPCETCGTLALLCTGLCGSCYGRQWRAAQTTKAASDLRIRREDFCDLRDHGEGLEIAAQRVGITLATAESWDRRRLQVNA